MTDKLQQLVSDVWALEDAFNRVCVDPSINFKREVELAIQVIYGNDYLAGLAIGNPQSLLDSLCNLGIIGLSLSPARKQAYLVPRDGKVVLDISYLGMIDLAVASGAIKWVQAAIVRKGDSFKLNGYGRAPDHSYDPFSTERGDIVGAYVVAKTNEGDFLAHTMTIERLLAIKARAKSSKKGGGPWATDTEEMMKKTVVKQASKYWPHVERLEKAVSYLNDGDEGIDFAAEQAASPVEVVGKPTVQMPKSKSAPVQEAVTDVQPKTEISYATISPARVKWIEGKLQMKGWTYEEALLKAGIESVAIECMNEAEFDIIKGWLR